MKKFLKRVLIGIAVFLVFSVVVAAISDTTDDSEDVEVTEVVETTVATEPVVLEFLNDLEYTEEEIEAMRTVLTNVGITEITELEVSDNSYGMQVIKGLAYKDTSFLADANDEVQVMFNIENGAIYLISVYCPSYYSENRQPYLSGLEDRRADLYYDVEGGYLKKIDWENKAVIDY